MIYCVVPEPLADELYPKLSEYYADDPNVTVIIDRRKSDRRAGEDRRSETRSPDGETMASGRREIRDRRRARATGDFPRIDPE
ncbi:MAG TPA: hypothetical protein VFR97_03015 [Capillimicrobium sp.]|nr:hypothetical protein [Capillimicrobium sp.]